MSLVLRLIQTLKGIGAFLAAYTVADIQTDQKKFIYALAIYALISIPTDLLIDRQRVNNAKKENQAQP